MSGSSSSGRSFIRGGGNSTETPIQDCTNLSGNTHVISPTMVYFGTASIGDILNIELDNSIVILLDSSGNEVGTINPTWIIKLIDCLNNGNKYVAVITKINGAAIIVSIQEKD